MIAAELTDLRSILRDGQRAEALDDCIALLKALPWTSPAEKLVVWQQLPLSLRRWLSQSVQGPQSA